MIDVTTASTAELVGALIEQESLKADLNKQLLSAFNGYVTALSVVPDTEFADRLGDIQYCGDEIVEGSDGEVVVDNFTLISKEVPIDETDKQFAFSTHIQIPVHKVPNAEYGLEEVPTDVLTRSIKEAKRLDIGIDPQNISESTGSAELIITRNPTYPPLSVVYGDKSPASQADIVLATRLLNLGTVALTEN